MTPSDQPTTHDEAWQQVFAARKAVMRSALQCMIDDLSEMIEDGDSQEQQLNLEVANDHRLYEVCYDLVAAYTALTLLPDDEEPS